MASRTSPTRATADPAAQPKGKHKVTIHHLLTTRVVSCSPADSLNRVAQLMWENDIGAIPVVEAHSNVVGMLTDRDIAMAAYLRGRPLAEITVESTMSREVHSLGPSDSPKQAAMMMREKQIRRLPIVDKDGVLVGMLSLNDLAKATESGKAGPIESAEVSETLRKICAPRHRGAAAASA
jgi:CBS domain-containing protein